MTSDGYKVARKNYGYVVELDGKEVSGILDEIDRAHEKIAGLKRKAAMKDRACMCCQTVFQSEGAHNRMCTPCRKLDTGMM